MSRDEMEEKVGDSVDAFPEGLPLQYATSTRAGLTAGFGKGPGGPRRYGRQTTSPFLRGGSRYKRTACVICIRNLF